MNATIIDGFEFCRSAKEVSGTTPVAEFERLCADLTDSRGLLSWSFRGGVHPEGGPALLMEVAVKVRLVCQRCMAPFDYSLETAATLLLANDESQADEVQARIGDDGIDVIVGSTSMDLMTLVEDEVLLSLPLSARHEVCPGEVQAAQDDKAESPFAVLKKRKP